MFLDVSNASKTCLKVRAKSILDICNEAHTTASLPDVSQRTQPIELDARARHKSYAHE